MKNLLLASILMIILGVVALTYQGITYTTTEKAIDIGPLQITAERTHTIPLLPILGVTAIVVGVVLLVASRRNTSALWVGFRNGKLIFRQD